MRLHSYVVRYDSGFAPNPFYGFCTLATCKPDIRKAAAIGDWVVGSGSADKKLKRGGFLVYAMRVTETPRFAQYWQDPRFQNKKPNLSRSRMRECGDNIYSQSADGAWSQLNSFHSRDDGSPNPRHIKRDTGVDRVLVSNTFVYFGGEGPKIPAQFRNYGGEDICKQGQGRKIFDDPHLIGDFAAWLQSLDRHGYAGRPLDWVRSP
ncbi:MAG: hypothetical protein WDN01_16775 [Rhizomicrobium sp.]